MALTNKEHYAKMVCLFLAEGIRTRKITLKRSAEIAEKVLLHLSLLDTEKDFLALVKELAKDFDEIIDLEGRIIRQDTINLKRHMEEIVKEFAVSIMASNSHLALDILQEATHDAATLEALAKKFPEFNNFLKSHA